MQAAQNFGVSVPADRRRYDPQLRPAEVADDLVAGLEVADREEGPGAGEGGGHDVGWHAGVTAAPLAFAAGLPARHLR